MEKMAIIVLIAIFVGPWSHAQSNSIEIWLRAFIPDPQNAGGGIDYIKQTPSGSSCVSLHHFDPTIPNICFATDHRGFSDNAKATSRLETKFTLTLNSDGTGKVTPIQNRTTAEITKKIDCTTGNVLEEKPGSVDRDHIGTPAVADGIVQVIGGAQGRNLLTAFGSNGPSIDYSFDIQWKPSTSTLVLDVTIGSFPAFEAYARQPNSKWIPIIWQIPTGAPWQLGGDSFGLNSMRIVETKIVNGLTGKWTSPSPEQRFTIEFIGSKIKWTEKNQSGTTCTREVDIVEIAKGKFKIERPNDEEVLKFQGFQPSLRSQILLKNPQPSFLIFYRDNEKLIAEWNGLIAIKDENANLKELIQPGIRPPKIYNLTE